MNTEILDADGSADSWFVRRGGEVEGPFPSGRIRHDLLEGQVAMEDEVSRDQQHWQRVAEVPAVVPHAFRVDPGEEEAALSAQRWREQRKAYLTIMLAVGLFGLALAITVLLDQTVPQPAATCDTPAGPGVQWQHCLMKGMQVPAADLRGANLSSADLSGGNLAGANLRKADLRFVNLGGASLALSRLQLADLTGADLRGADLSSADLSGADLSYADLTGAHLEGALFNDAQLNGAIWTDGRHCAEGSVGRCVGAGNR